MVKLEKIALEDWQKEIVEEYCSGNLKKLKALCNPIIRGKGFSPERIECDELYSLAEDVLLQCVVDFDNTRECSFNTYLSVVIKKRFCDWTRHQRRAKRCNVAYNPDGTIKKDDTGNNIVIQDEPLDKISDDGINLCEKVESGYRIDDDIFSFDENVDTYLKSLQKKSRDILILKMNGYSTEEIKKKLHLSQGEYTKYLQRARKSEKLELFTKTYREGKKMQKVMPIDTTDSYRMDKLPLGTLLDQKRDGDINCEYILQRKAFQWTERQVNKFLTRVLNSQPVPEIVICEQYIGKKKKRHLIDGLQRLSYASLFRANGCAVGLNGAEYYEISYLEKQYDENGDPVYDDDGDIKVETKVCNVIGKTFSELPKYIRDRFEGFNVNVTTYFNCTDDQIAYHIRNYNNQEGMNQNQYEMTNIDIGIAEQIRSISYNHKFFKERYGAYTEKNETKGALDRVVAESIMTTNFLQDWKRTPEDIYQYVNQNATIPMFDDFRDSLDRLCKVVNKGTKKLFSTTNSSTWFAVFEKFKKLDLPDSKFAEFIEYFNESFDTLQVGGKSFAEVYKSRNTKDKVVITGKINGIVAIMLEYLGIDGKVANEEPVSIEQFIADCLDVDVNVVSEDMEFYEESLDDLLLGTVRVDSKLRDKVNRSSLLAIMAYSYKEDVDLDDWLCKYAKDNNTYFIDQKKNYVHMKKDLLQYIDKKERVSA